MVDDADSKSGFNSLIPLKQGLKQSWDGEVERRSNKFNSLIPLKQGLKQIFPVYFISVFCGLIPSFH